MYLNLSWLRYIGRAAALIRAHNTHSYLKTASIFHMQHSSSCEREKVFGTRRATADTEGLLEEANIREIEKKVNVFVALEKK